MAPLNSAVPKGVRRGKGCGMVSKALPLNSAVPAMRKRRGPRREVTILASSSRRLTWFGLGLGFELGLGSGSGLELGLELGFELGGGLGSG